MANKEACPHCEEMIPKESMRIHVRFCSENPENK